MKNNEVEYKVGVTEIRAITELLLSKYNVDFTQYALSSFQRRIKRVLEVNGLDDVDQLLDKIRKDSVFVNEFIEEITVNTTEMFRAPSMWKVMKKEVLERLKSKSHINIWHAGCSSGEEVFSMAIILEEMGLKDKVTLYATDINTTVIEKAQRGICPLRKMELNEANYKRMGGTQDFKKYYGIKGFNAVMSPDLISNVKYSVHNLAQDASFKKFDIILCRNVMIYFDKVLQDQVFKLFHESLHIGAYLIIGSKESMIWSSVKNKFKVIDEKERIYKVLV